LKWCCRSRRRLNGRRLNSRGRRLAIGYRLAQDASREIVRIDRERGIDLLQRERNVARFARGAGGSQMKLKLLPAAVRVHARKGCKCGSTP